MHPYLRRQRSTLALAELGRKYGMPTHLCQHDGKLYISRLARCCAGASPFVTLQIRAGMTLMGLIRVVACSYEDLVECWEHTTWWVVPIDKSCASSPSKIFRSQHLLLILGEDTVPVAFSEARFQVKKSACFWRHGRYQE